MLLSVTQFRNPAIKSAGFWPKAVIGQRVRLTLKSLTLDADHFLAFQIPTTLFDDKQVCTYKV